MYWHGYFEPFNGKLGDKLLNWKAYLTMGIEANSWLNLLFSHSIIYVKKGLAVARDCSCPDTPQDSRRWGCSCRRVQFWGSQIDITERKQAEQQILQYQEPILQKIGTWAGLRSSGPWSRPRVSRWRRCICWSGGGDMRRGLMRSSTPNMWRFSQTRWLRTNYEKGLGCLSKSFSHFERRSGEHLVNSSGQLCSQAY